MAKKKKLKLKKKNFAIFCLIISIFILSICQIPQLFVSKKETIKTKTYKVKKEKNPFEKFDFYNKKNRKRYISYKKKHQNISNKEVIINVNIGLDYPYYENARKATNLNKETILVNKYNYLEEDYVPNNLVTIDLSYARSGMKLVDVAHTAFIKMADDAEKENLKLVVTSSYRDYEYQEKIYNQYVKSDGKEEADTYSGRPGFSEHQTGLCVDLYNGVEVYTNFDKTKEFEWMQDNAHKYGFILRFPKDKEDKTGYQYESWHYRYVGKEIATYMYERNLCYEEYYAMFLDK